MTLRLPKVTSRIVGLIVCSAVFAVATTTLRAATDNPLAPPDRSSPRATLRTFLDSIDLAWEMYSAGDTGFLVPFVAARDCLDLTEIPPLVFEEASTETALVLQEVLDRIELPPWNRIPDHTAVEEQELTRWTVPHTEIRLVRISEGDREGQWVFSKGTVARVDEFYGLVRHMPYRPGRTGGHVEELRAGSKAIVLLKFVKRMPPWFRSELGGMLTWQWFGLAMMVTLLAISLITIAWVARRWRRSGARGVRLASYLVPVALVNVPLVGGVMINRLFELPGTPALVMRLTFSVIGYVGLAWLLALVITRIGDLIASVWFRDARPLKQQLVRVVFRIVTIVVVTVVTLRLVQSLGVPVAGLIAGLGVGGLAIALAAQGTLENFIGGIILYADQPVKVGDFCLFGDRRGTVENVGLRSVKIRTIDRTLVTVPNAEFAKLHLENLTERDRVLLRENLCLRYETTPEQLQTLLADLESMLIKHDRIAEEPLRVRFNGFREYYLEIELFAYALTNEWAEFLTIRQDVLIRVMEIIDHSGTRLALPTEIHHAGGPA